jgi:hypothetical protein
LAAEFETRQQTVQAGWHVGPPTTDDAVASSYYLSGRPTAVDATFDNGTITLVDRAGNHRASVDASSHAALEFRAGALNERAIAHADGIRDRATDAERAADVDRI